MKPERKRGICKQLFHVFIDNKINRPGSGMFFRDPENHIHFSAASRTSCRVAVLTLAQVGSVPWRQRQKDLIFLPSSFAVIPYMILRIVALCSGIYYEPDTKKNNN